MRRELHLVFQDPTASLNPRMTVVQLVGEGVYIHHLRQTTSERHVRVTELLQLAGIDETGRMLEVAVVVTNEDVLVLFAADGRPEYLALADELNLVPEWANKSRDQPARKY